MKTETEFEEFQADWNKVEQVMPLKSVPKLPKHESFPTPSGWFPPKGISPFSMLRKRSTVGSLSFIEDFNASFFKNYFLFG